MTSSLSHFPGLGRLTVAATRRRELRGYSTVAAWLNHVDSNSTNILDTLVTERDRTFVRHYLLDFGSTLGSAGV